MCNSTNLKPGGIIELLLKIVNILHMHPGLGVAHSDQQQLDMTTAESARSALLLCLTKSTKRFCTLKDFVCKWYPSLKSGSARSFSLARDQVFYF